MAKPKGYWDDIMKLARKAAAAGNDKVAKDLRRKADMVAEDTLRSSRGKQRMIKEWNSRIGKFDYSVADEQQAKSVSARLREQARQRGLKAKSQKIGKKEEANVRQSLEQAAKRDDIAKARKAAGGRNNPNAVKARQKKSANARKAVKPKPAAGGAGKGPKNPKKTGTASAPKGPKKPRK